MLIKAIPIEKVKGYKSDRDCEINYYVTEANTGIKKGAKEGEDECSLLFLKGRDDFSLIESVVSIYKEAGYKVQVKEAIHGKYINIDWSGK